MPEAFSFESRRHGGLLHHGVVAFLRFSGRDIADGLEKPSVVEPVDPFEGGELNRLERAPRAAPVNDFSLVKAVDGFCQSVVLAVADASNRRLNPDLCQPLGVFDRDVLDAAVRVVDKSATLNGLAIMEGLFKGV